MHVISFRHPYITCPGTVFRGLGKNLTEAQISSFINATDHDGSGRLDFDTFYQMMLKEGHHMRGSPTFEQVMEHFKVFDIYRDG